VIEPMPRSAGLTAKSIAEGSAQYRDRYAEPEAGLAALCPDGFDMVLVVPVCGESATFVDGYRAAAPSAGRLLVIVVLNGRVDADPAVHAGNADCFSRLRSRFSLQEFGPGGWLGRDATIRVLVVDRFTVDRRLPSRQGVGLARKIGADLALELIATGRVGHPYVAMTDADALLPEDYFDRVAELSDDCSAAVLPFWHEPGGESRVDRATALYEIHLRYLLRGLQWAHSPYAFHAVGSTMAVHALRYAQVRGVPKRQAAEDFYLLNKLSKLRPLARLRGEPVRIRSRVSTRVPFGTGAETAKLIRHDALALYHPDCFSAVRDMMRTLGQVSGAPGHSTATLLAQMSPLLRQFLEWQGAPGAWPTLSEQSPNPRERLRRFHDWFDGFRTLKLIHHVRDYAQASIPWRDAIHLAPFMDEMSDDGTCLREARTGLLHGEQSLPRLVGPSVCPGDESSP
jgi:hypothetical protein